MSLPEKPAAPEPVTLLTRFKNSSPIDKCLYCVAVLCIIIMAIGFVGQQSSPSPRPALQPRPGLKTKQSSPLDAIGAPPAPEPVATLESTTTQDPTVTRESVATQEPGNSKTTAE